MPERIQRRRTKGWRAPAGAVYVGRPTKWGNPFRIGLIPCNCRSAGECDHNLFRCETAEEAVREFKWRMENAAPKLTSKLDELRGKDLICWCPLVRPCHADVLLELANAPGGL